MTQKLHFTLPLLLLLIVPAFSLKRIDVPIKATLDTDQIQNDDAPTVTSSLDKASRKSAIAPQDRSDFLKFDPAGNVLSKASLFAQDGDDSIDTIIVSDPNARDDASTQQDDADTTTTAQEDDEKQPAASLGDDEPASTQSTPAADTKKEPVQETNDDAYDDDSFIMNDDQDDTKTEEKVPPDTKDTESKPAASGDSKDSETAAPADSKADEPAAAPVAPVENRSTLIKSLLISIGMGAGVILMAFVCYYRYQLEKYKIPPFTPPRCCPNCLFPRSFDRNKGTPSESYQMIEVYNPPELSSRF